MPLVGFHVFSLEKHPNLDPTTPEILQLGGGIQKNPSVLSMVSSYKPMHSKQTQMAGKRKEPQKNILRHCNAAQSFPWSQSIDCSRAKVSVAGLNGFKMPFASFCHPFRELASALQLSGVWKKSGKSRLQDVILFLTFLCLGIWWDVFLQTWSDWVLLCSQVMGQLSWVPTDSEKPRCCLIDDLHTTSKKGRWWLCVLLFFLAALLCNFRL